MNGRAVLEEAPVSAIGKELTQLIDVIASGFDTGNSGNERSESTADQQMAASGV